MAARTTALRRGLPRVPGGDAWPPAHELTLPEGATVTSAPAEPAPEDAPPLPPTGGGAEDTQSPQLVEAQPEVAHQPSRPASDPVVAAAVSAPSAGTAPAPSEAPEAGSAALAASAQVSLRRGLPRVAGGPPWPDEQQVAVLGAAPTGRAAAPVPESRPEGTVPAPTREPEGTRASQRPDGEGGVESAPAAIVAGTTEAIAMRRGLPRVRGAEPWPPASAAPRRDVRPAEPTAAATPTPEPAAATTRVPEPEPQPAAAPPPPAPVTAAAPAAPPAKPEPARAAAAPKAEPVKAAARTTTPAKTPTAPGRGNATTPEGDRERRRFGRFTLPQWALVGVGSLAGLALIAAVLVLASWGLLTVTAVKDFVARHPGTAPQPASTPQGIPGWLGWQHFFNLFLMVQIIRTGLRVRREQRPPAYFSWRGTGSKMSIFAWLHVALDTLWLVNGVMFVILLFATGQWMRVIPTSWEVFPNALTAALQYVSLRWPTDNPWTHYNALQQLTYFATIFIAAPISAVSGARMLGLGSSSRMFQRVMPVERARKLHVPTMVYFVAFIIVHVLLVLVTGMRRNLNAMFAAKGAADPSVFAADWTGFGFLVATLAVVVLAWFAVRPSILAPIARRFGTVSSR